MPSHRLAHEIREDISRPHHEEQIQQIKRARPLLAKLHQHPHGQRNVCECEHRGCRRRIPAAQIRPPHRNGEKQKRSNRSGKSQAVYKHRRGKQRFLIPQVKRQQEKEHSDENVGGEAQRLHAVGFGQLQEFMNREQRHSGRHDRQALAPAPAKSAPAQSE